MCYLFLNIEWDTNLINIYNTYAYKRVESVNELFKVRFAQDVRFTSSYKKKMPINIE